MLSVCHVAIVSAMGVIVCLCPCDSLLVSSFLVDLYFHMGNSFIRSAGCSLSASLTDIRIVALIVRHSPQSSYAFLARKIVNLWCVAMSLFVHCLSCRCSRACSM